MSHNINFYRCSSFLFHNNQGCDHLSSILTSYMCTCLQSWFGFVWEPNSTTTNFLMKICTCFEFINWLATTNLWFQNQLNTVKEDLDSEREQAQKRPQKRPSDAQINGIDVTSNPQVVELQRESSRQISEYKLKVQKAELDIAALESSVSLQAD